MNKFYKHLNTYKHVYFVGVFLLFVSTLVGLNTDNNLSLEGKKIFFGDELSAEAVFVIDEKTGEVLYEKNSSQHFEIASITKLMTALVSMEELLGESIYIDRQSFYSVGDTGLLINEKWKTEDLVSFMLVNSSNDAAEALAKTYPRGREKFIERMNDRARELSLEMIFKNPTKFDLI